jgi:hypothetical protein
MHLTGNESHGERENLAYGCRSCNGKLAAAFKTLNLGKPTNQYNPSSGVPTFEQYMWAVSNHERKAHDAGGAVIHATPKHKRIEYARRIVSKAQATKRERADERWNPPAKSVVSRAAEYNENSHKWRIVEQYSDGSMRRLKGAFKTKAEAEAGPNKSNPWPFSRPDARRTTPAHGGIAYHQGKMKGRKKTPDDLNAEYLKTLPKSRAKKPAGASAMPDEATLQAGFKRGLSLADMLGVRNPGIPVSDWKKDFYRQGFEIGKADRTKEYPTFRDASKVNEQALWMADILVDSWGVPKSKAGVIAEQFSSGYSDGWRGHRRKKNPAAGAVEVFEDFHGFEPTEVLTVQKQVHHHAHLASLGNLVELDVWGVDGKGHKVSGFKGALLACNESRDQLFIEGGDQTMNLVDFGIRKPHEAETLGRVTNIGYKTNKTHLGDEGGEAVYVHRFRATNQNGKHVVVKMTREPDLIYDVRNEQLLFSGGSYEILREGINK